MPLTPLPQSRAALDVAYVGARVVTPAGVAGTDTAALQAAMTASASDGKPVVLGGGRFVLNAGLAWDPTKYSVIGGHDTILDFTALATGYAISVASSATSGQAFKQITTAFAGCTIEGPTANGTTTDCISTSDGTVTNPVLNFRDLKITGFRDQLTIGDKTWCIAVERVAFAGWNRRAINYAGNSNSGENLYFSACVFHDAHNSTNDAVALYVPTSEADATFNFHGCSFDYNDLEMDLRQGHVNLFGCYLEDDSTGPMIKITASSTTVFSMIGGRVFIRAAAPDRTSIVDHISGTGGHVNFTNVQFTTYLRDYKIVRQVVGTPVVRFGGCYITKGSDDATKQVFPGDYSNLLNNGGWEANATTSWAIAGSVGTPTIQTADKNSGTYALQFVGTGVAGNKDYGQNYPIRPNESVVTSTTLKVTGLTGGSVVLTIRAIERGGNQIGSDTWTISANTTGYQTYKRYWTPPAGTASVTYEIRFANLNGTAVVDDSYMAIV